MNKNNAKEKILVFLTNFDFKKEVEYVQIIIDGLSALSCTDAMFEVGFNDMMQKSKSDMYGRPALGDWIASCQIPSRKERIDNERNSQKVEFIEKVSDYLGDKFVPEYIHNEFMCGLSDLEEKLLRRFGGMKQLWASVNSDGYNRTVSKVVKELGEDFDSAYSHEMHSKSIEMHDSAKLLIEEHGATMPKNVIKKMPK